MKKTANLVSLVLLALVISIVLPFAACSTVTTKQTNIITTTTTQTTLVTTTITTTPTEPKPPVTLNVSAASSLTAAIKDIDAQYTKENPNVTFSANFASSGTLQKQIEQGAPADVFISAGSSQMDSLAKENMIITDTRKNLLNNKLVLVVPADSTLGISSFNDLTSANIKQIAIGDPKSVPAGTYAQKAFDLLGITDEVSSKYVIGADVKAVLSYVESGNVDAGLVYLTDAMTSTKVKVVATAPDTINAQIVYPVAVVAASKVTDAARAYENYLFGNEAKTIFEKYGFTVIGQ